MKLSIYVGLQICQFASVEDFGGTIDKTECMNESGLAYIQRCMQKSSEKAEAQLDCLVKSLTKCYQYLGCNMSLKIYFLYSHYSFLNDEGGARNELGEKFNKNIVLMDNICKTK